mmetsp:Transcript_110105/g.350766  ORF Transcript_110105/g.350766 Transcript_110105/m.350766 type:complete len:257 (+) Transcript_110105:2266-3036(+)
MVHWTIGDLGVRRIRPRGHPQAAGGTAHVEALDGAGLLVRPNDGANVGVVDDAVGHLHVSTADDEEVLIRVQTGAVDGPAAAGLGAVRGVVHRTGDVQAIATEVKGDAVRLRDRRAHVQDQHAGAIYEAGSVHGALPHEHVRPIDVPTNGVQGQIHREFHVVMGQEDLRIRAVQVRSPQRTIHPRRPIHLAGFCVQCDATSIGRVSEVLHLRAVEVRTANRATLRGPVDLSGLAVDRHTCRHLATNLAGVHDLLDI